MTGLTSTSKTLLLGAILLLSLALNLQNNDFSIFLHIDEGKKVDVILGSPPEFLHPLLMIQIGRVLNGLLGIRDPQAIVEVMRNVSAVFGMLAVLATYPLARRLLPDELALVSVLGVAISPVLVVHAHYLKEDIYFLVIALLTLSAYLSFAERPTGRSACVLGLALGLAFAAQYKAILFLAVFLVDLVVTPRLRSREALKSLGLTLGIAMVVFSIVNVEAFLDSSRFLGGVSFEIHHMENGHDIKISALSSLFSFHLLNSLVPGLTAPVVILGLGGLIWCLVPRMARTHAERLLALYVVVFYLGHELVPAKPEPDFMRYMMPITPVVIVFAVSALAVLARSFRPLWAAQRTQLLAGASACLIFLWPTYVSVQLNRYLTQDTRDLAATWLEERGQKAISEPYGLPRDQDVSSAVGLDPQELKKQGVTYLAVSSFRYERFLRGESLPRQDGRVYQLAKWYRQLFLQPHVTFAPAFRSFAFSNPTVMLFPLDTIDPVLWAKTP